MKILWLQTELLHPVDKGGRIRTYQMLRELKRANHIAYLTLDDGTAGPDAHENALEYCHKLECVPHRTSEKFSAAFYAEVALNLASRLPYVIRKYQSAQLSREIARCVARERPDVLICDFLAPAVNLPNNLPCATVLFQHNVEAMIWKRHYQVQSHPLKRAYLYGQWRKMRAFELAACRRFDQVIAVSREDQELMRREYGLTAVADVPTGVHTEYFRPRSEAPPEPYNVVFTGSMDWLPNEDAIRYFTEDILPRIKQDIPQIKLTVVGRNPSPGLIALSQRDPSVIVTGRVEDVRPHIERAAACVVPIRIAGGTRLKIYEAMALEKPVISTTIGAEGLPVRNGVELLLADTPETFASAVTRVLTDSAFGRLLGTRAARTVREQFGWDKVSAKFAEICQQTLERHARDHKKRELAGVEQSCEAVGHVLRGDPE